jgi:hypothetical protein
MKKICIYGGACLLVLISINVSIYFVPVYHLPWSSHAILGPLTIYLAYFIFGLPLVMVYFWWVLKDKWHRALLKGGLTVLVYVIVAAIVAFFFMRSNR